MKLDLVDERNDLSIMDNILLARFFHENFIKNCVKVSFFVL